MIRIRLSRRLPKSKPKEILDAAISEFGISEAGAYAAEMRHILYAHKYE